MSHDDQRSRETKRSLSVEEKIQLTEIYATAISDTTEADVAYVLGAIEPKLMMLDSEDPSLCSIVSRVCLLKDILGAAHDGIHALSRDETQAIAAALFYFVMPFDLIPDCLPEEGYLDDRFVVSLCMERLRPMLETRIRERGELPSTYGL